MDSKNGPKEPTWVTASNTLSVNIFTAPGLEDHELRIVEQGRTDCPDSTSLYAPSVGTIVTGDVVYNRRRMYVGDTTPEEPKELDRNAGSIRGVESGGCCRRSQEGWRARLSSTIQDTRRCLQNFDRVQKTVTSDHELFDQMTELYPHWVANRSWLMFGFPQP